MKTRDDLLRHLAAQARRDQARPFERAGPLLHIVLVQPEIPQNTGNIGRLCVGMGARLHLVGPLGFELSERALKRAGLDYWKYLDWREHEDIERFLGEFEVPPERRFLLSKWSAAPLWEARFEAGDALLFGRETSGLPGEFPARAAGRRLAIPRLGPVRSFNLANSVAIAGFELLRQVLYGG